MLGVQDERTGVVWFYFEGPTFDGVPTAWRSDLLSVLRAFQGGPHPDDVVIATGELVANGVEHGGGVGRLHVRGRQGVVTVEVDDFRSSLTRLRDVESRPEGSRGLQIVAAVADSWGWRPSELGKTVWATFLPADGTDVERPPTGRAARPSRGVWPREGRVVRGLPSSTPLEPGAPAWPSLA
jgi:hypothetical protein